MLRAVLRRALWVVAVAVPLVIPAHAQAKRLCGSASVVAGAAPLTVTFTSTCGAVHWDFGDGQSADGESAAHTFAAGAWPVYAGEEKVAVVTSRAVSLRVPRLVGFRHRLTFRGAVVPPLANEQVLVLVRGRFLASTRTRADGTFNVTRRIGSPGPYAAQWVDARSLESSATVKPRIVASVVGAPTVGQRLAVRAHIVPTAAGTIRIRVWRGPHLVVDARRTSVKLPTRAAASYRIRVTSAPAPGYASAARTLTAAVALPHLRRGATGPSVRALEQRLLDLHYALERVDAVYGQDTYDAVLAFQKVSGLSRTGEVDPALWRRLQVAATPHARYGGDHVEVDKSRQVLLEVRGGKVALVVQVSTGATGNTPVGLWHVYSRVPGWSWVLWYPTYFLRGFAIHGYPDVPPWPASHGCVRVPMWIATRLYAMHPYGFPIYVY
jgi:peptidoglycan hydrolase-like protein with peptidoglycan-binding domain